jgi:hypothetical protein
MSTKTRCAECELQAVNNTLKLLDMFASRGTPLTYLNIDYDEIQGMARDSRYLTTNLCFSTRFSKAAIYSTLLINCVCDLNN